MPEALPVPKRTIQGQIPKGLCQNSLEEATGVPRLKLHLESAPVGRGGNEVRIKAGRQNLQSKHAVPQRPTSGCHTALN